MRVTTDNVTLVGTAHVSPTSVREVEATIRALEPQAVCVELDETRLQALRDPHAWAEVPVLDLVREGKGPQLLAQIVLGSYQRRIGEETGVQPGRELLTAIDTAEEVGAEVHLTDRDVGLTLRRAFGAMPLTEKARVTWEILKAAVLPADEEDPVDAEAVEELLEEDALTEAMEELADLAPSASSVLIDERDAYMATRILDVRDGLGAGEGPTPHATFEAPDEPDEADPDGEAPAEDPSDPSDRDPDPANDAGPRRGEDADGETEPADEDDPADGDELDLELAPDEGGDVLAVLGAGHLEGVRERIEGDQRADLDELEADTSSSFPWGKAAAWTLTAAVASVFAYLLYQGITTGDFSQLRSGALWYLVLSGTLASLGCLIAGGHPFSVVVAFLASPLTSLHPAVAAGWFAGATEAWRREPKVGDVEGLREIYTFSDMRENNLVRVLLVAALVNLGSIAGSWAGFAKLFDVASLVPGVLG